MAYKDKNSIIDALSSIRSELEHQFSVKSIGLFGSFVRGDETEESDLDIIVELTEPTFDHYMDLKFRLEELFNKPVDLVLADSVKPRLRPIIEKEVVYA